MNQVIKVTKETELILNDFLSNLLPRDERSGSIRWKNTGVAITLYSTGKVLFQGKDATYWYEQTIKFLGIETIAQDSNSMKKTSEESVSYSGQNRVGIDESGKGDFFGPLVTAAFVIKNNTQEKKLESLGIKDSKVLNDNKITELANELKKMGTYEIIMISPVKYNQLWAKMGNVNKLLAWSHARALENILLKENIDLAISDQFGDESLISDALLENGKRINLVQMHKAESDFAVAAASILARDTFVQKLKALEKKLGVILPKGASEKVIEQGVQIYKKFGKDKFSDIAKVHFKTYDKIISFE
ncbi:ribonuclease HIII [Paenibacillus sp. FSL K6-2862]|uniref:ribonuclease HIII n=1 Tax=Paenibacillus sp. FSL K6-2862 TaxID=2921484 RepID=UPI0030FC010C